MKRPVLHCFAACVFPDGRIWGDVFYVTLETADYMRGMGYVIIGPDPQDQIDLASWERSQALRLLKKACNGRP